MWVDIKELYAAAWRFARFSPWLFLLPAVPELLQHGAEVHLGMYASRAGAHAAAQDGLRLGFGYVKVLGLLLPTYWFVRYLAWGDARRAARVEQPAAILWLVTFAISAALSAWNLFGPGWGALVGLKGRAALGFGAGASLVLQAAQIYLLAWGVAWALGNARIGPVRSVGVMAGSFWRTIGYLVAGTMPLMVVHYALGLGAIGRPAWDYWPIMVVDAGVVAFLALTVCGSGYVAVRHAARRRGVPLDPGEPAAPALSMAAFAGR